METSETVDELRALVQLDIDAVYAYRQAIDHVEVAEVRERVTHFCLDHENHVKALSELIQKYGAAPPDFSRDLQGFVVEGLTALRSIAGNHSALSAIHDNEEEINQAYGAILAKDLPADVRAVLERHYAEEMTHIAFIGLALRPEESQWVMAGPLDVTA